MSYEIYFRTEILFVHISKAHHDRRWFFGEIEFVRKDWQEYLMILTCSRKSQRFRRAALYSSVHYLIVFTTLGRLDSCKGISPLDLSVHTDTVFRSLLGLPAPNCPPSRARKTRNALSSKSAPTSPFRGLPTPPFAYGTPCTPVATLAL